MRIAPFILTTITLSMGLPLLAQEAAKPAPAAPAPKVEAPKPITQAEKDNFHAAYTEYLEAQNQYATTLLGLKKQMEDLETKSGTDMQAKAQGIQQLFNELSKRCTAPKVFDRLKADCGDPPATAKK